MKYILKKGLLFALLWTFWSWKADTAYANQYQLDPDHTNITFKIRHLFTKVMGRFDRFKGTITYDPKDPKKWKVQVTIKTASINTNVKKRDKHLRSKDFFDAKKHPQILFQSTGVKNISPDKKHAVIEGTLFMHGVKRKISLPFQILGEMTDPWGKRKISFTAHMLLNRKDFNINWNKKLDRGGWLLGDDVEIQLDVEAYDVSKKK